MLYISNPVCKKHRITPNHPEAPERLQAIEQALFTAGLWTRMQHEDSRAATEKQLQYTNSMAYLEYLKKVSPVEGYYALDADTGMNLFTLEAALCAAGAGIQAVDRIMQGKAKTAFCGVRPPGHHAGRDKAMGFCFINNVAVAAYHALNTYSISRIAILDFDVHHGNGTQDIFEKDERVLYCSTHQYPFYPGTGRTPAQNNIINAILGEGADGDEFKQAITAYWLPAISRFQPEFIFVSAGFDAHRDDLLGGLRLIEHDYAWVGQQIKNIADRNCKGRVVSCLEGGYNLKVLGRCVSAYLQELMQV